MAISLNTRVVDAVPEVVPAREDYNVSVVLWTVNDVGATECIPAVVGERIRIYKIIIFAFGTDDFMDWEMGGTRFMRIWLDSGVQMTYDFHEMPIVFGENEALDLIKNNSSADVYFTIWWSQRTD